MFLQGIVKFKSLTSYFKVDGYDNSAVVISN